MGTSEGARKAWDTRGRKQQALTERSQRALATYNPVTPQKVQMAKLSERQIARAVGGVPTADNSPFDILIKGKIGVEVKTLLEAGNDKVTMHPLSLERKLVEAKRMKLDSTYTVAVDLREGAPKVYYKAGLGSFRLSAMTQVAGYGALKKIMA